MTSGAYDAEGNPYTPNPPLSITDKEREAMDSIIEGIPSRMRRKAIRFQRPRFMDKEPEPLARLDALIVELLTEAKKTVKEDVAEKLFDRMQSRSVIEKYDDEQGSIDILLYRLMDSMQCMVAIKEKYRGRKCRSNYDKKTASEQLRLRGLLRR